MANFGQLILTNKGLQAQVEAQGGGGLKFKRIGMGSGEFSGNIATLTSLVTENVSISITNGYMQNNAYTVEGLFSNEALQTGFEWREIGVYIEDSNGNEILYCYANAGSSYDYIPATADERYSKYIRIAMVVGNAENVSIVESEGIIYVDLRTFNAHLNDKDNPHGVTAAQVGAAEVNHKHPYSINIGYDRADINSGADLNDILSMGCYRCATATRAATLRNCPTKNAFIMDVVASTGGNSAVDKNSYSYGTQRIYSLGGREYVRQVTSNADGTITYGEWITMYSTLDKPTPTEIGAANTAFSNIPDIPAALNNLHLTSNFKGTVDGKAYTFNTAITQAEYSVAGTDIEGAPYTGTCYGKLVVLINNGTTHNNTSNWAWQVFYSTTFWRVYIRNKVNDGDWGAWSAFYNQNYKPTPADIGALPLAGGTLSGALTVIDNFNVNKTYDDVEYKTYIKPINYSIAGNGDYSTGIIHYKDGVNIAQIMFNKDGIMFRDNVNAKAYKVYGQHNVTELRSNSLNRTTAVNAADTNYTTLMARGTSINSAETNPAVNGAICWQYK